LREEIISIYQRNRIVPRFIPFPIDLSILRDASDTRDILMGRYVDYFNRFLITDRFRMMSRARLRKRARLSNYVHEAFSETILPIVRL